MSTGHQNIELPSFEELVSLAEHNPKAFAVLKRELCEEMILSASERMQDRLWAQQSHIDRVINTSKNPIHANIRLMSELRTQVAKFQNALAYSPEEDEIETAEIIPLRQLPNTEDPTY